MEYPANVPLAGQTSGTRAKPAQCCDVHAYERSACTLVEIILILNMEHDDNKLVCYLR
jgi:hypothetical protein